MAGSSEETIALGRQLGERLRPPMVVLLYGELGAGKTTLAKGILGGLGVAREDEVTSPTFTLVHVFRHPRSGLRVYHADLYRVNDFHDLESLGLEDAFDEPSILLVEWAEKLTLRTDWPVVEIRMMHQEDETRRIEVRELRAAVSKP